ncbi:hypothetical protein BDZ89DRAFT_1162012 [Hymenopellis radicata]|nr:hypothetical protein BDZ89DRAFT_1162012 [Hymenopellis radicata]
MRLRDTESDKLSPVLGKRSSELPSISQKRTTLAGIITFLWFANTVILGLEWKGVDLLFIAHGTSLETEFNFYLTGDIALTIAVTVLRCLSVFVADLILVWRCWVLYGRNVKVIAIPSLCVITETISACIIMVCYVEDIAFIGASRTNWSLVYYSMTVATNSLCTVLILFRIVRVSGLGASLKTYRGIIEILVESAAMYAIIYIALLIAYAYQFYTGVTVMTANYYPEVISFSITGIAPTLIIARVMSGQSRPNDSWTRPSLPHMRSSVLSNTESLQFASAPNHSTQTTSTSTGDATANIDLEAQAQEVVEETREQDGDEDRAEAGVLASGYQLSDEKQAAFPSTVSIKTVPLFTAIPGRALPGGDGMYLICDSPSANDGGMAPSVGDQLLASAYFLPILPPSSSCFHSLTPASVIAVVSRSLPSVGQYAHRTWCR